MEALRRLLPKPDREWVARALTEALVRRGVERGSIAYDPDQYALRYGSEVSFLANLYADCCCAWPWQRRGRIERFARLRQGFATEREPFAAVRSRVLPAVRDRYMFEAVALVARADGNRPASHPLRPLGMRLAAGLVIDSEESMQLVSDEDLRHWGVSEDEAFVVAAGNLGRRPRNLESAGEGVYVGPWNDCHVPSRLALPDLLGDVDVDGEVVAVAPNWNHLILTGANHAAGLAGAIRFAMKVTAEEPKAMSALPIVKRGGEWVTLELPRGHAVEPLLRKARVLELSGVYADQKQLLDRVHEREELDVYVAAYNGVRHEETDSHSSYCVWAKGVDALLPRTEEISFFDDGQPEGRRVVGRFDWDIVELHCRELMRPTEHALQRFRVADFPSPDQLAAMARAQALRPARD